jgi:hypothetical protein
VTTGPDRPFRILRADGRAPQVISYRTRESRDTGARRYADRDNERVLTEAWSADLVDEVNGGWGCDGYVDPRPARSASTPGTG